MIMLFKNVCKAKEKKFSGFGYYDFCYYFTK